MVDGGWTNSAAKIVVTGMLPVIQQAERMAAVNALRGASDEFAEGAGLDHWASSGVDDDVSAVRATSAWFSERANEIEGGGDYA